MTVQKIRVVDLFCGAGGSSTGAEKAIAGIGGEMELVAVNHWNTAVATHAANHPTARHLVEDVSIVDPEEVVKEGRLDLLMASPECRFHSRARGGKPIHDQGRIHAWVIFNWLTKLDIKAVLVENVPEFVDWGKLNSEGRPDKAHKGEHFQAWFMTFHALGYHAEWRMLNAADYGDATTRTRFFLMARKDGMPILWPEPSHAKGDTGMFPGRRRWRGAREIIDWSNQGRSLLDDPKYRKKPLSVKTRRRIARGLERFGGPLAPLYIRLLDLPDETVTETAPNSNAEVFILNHHGESGQDQSYSTQHPAPTVDTPGADDLVEPAAEPFVLAHHRSAARSSDEPIPTVTTRGPGYLVEPTAKPFICANQKNNAPEPIPAATTAHGGGSFLVEPSTESFLLGQQSGGAPRSTDQPAPTVATDGYITLVQPAIIEYYGQSHARAVDDPLSVITSMNKHGLVKATLVEYYGRSGGADIDEPLPTVTAKARHGLADPVLIEVNHGYTQQGDAGDGSRSQSVEAPIRTVTTKRGLGLADPVLIEVKDGNGALVQPILVQTSHTGDDSRHTRPTDQPIPTLTTKADMCLATPTAKPYIVPNFGERKGQEPRVHDVDEPIPAVTSRGAGSLVSPALIEPILKQLNDAHVDPRRIIFVDGHPYLLDIRFRMLQNPELARAMGFDDEETQYEFVGNISEVTKQIGNAVPVHLAAALVAAILGPGMDS